MKHRRRRITYANVVATLALFLVLGGGTALASFIITSNDQVGPDTISGHNPPSGDGANLIAGSVHQADLAPDAEPCRTPGPVTIAARAHSHRVGVAGELRLVAN